MGQMGKCTLNHTTRSRDNSTELWKSTQRFQWYRFHKVCNKLTAHPPIWSSITIIALQPERLRDKVVSEVYIYFFTQFPRVQWVKSQKLSWDTKVQSIRMPSRTSTSILYIEPQFSWRQLSSPKCWWQPAGWFMAPMHGKGTSGMIDDYT